MAHVDRNAHVAAVLKLLRSGPVVALLGPRQVGKSTLAREVAERWTRGPVTTFDLERDADVRRLGEPSLVLAGLRGLVVLDEIQRIPNLFTTLRWLVDRPRTPARFLVLGSAAPALLQQSAESLAGRIAYHELPGFTVDEVGARWLQQLWRRGGFPRSFNARTERESARWRYDFIRTFRERELPALDVAAPAPALGRFWSMLAHVHGQTLSWSELGRSMSVADNTVRRYVDTLEAALVVRTLKPWHENISKRQVKAPKVFVRDSGLLHTLLDIETQEQLEGHPKAGASFEGFAIHEAMRVTGARPDQCYFWATHAGAELDLLVVMRGKRRGFEVKFTDAPGVTPSMRIALEDLKLDSLDVLHAGTETYSLAPKIRAVALSRIDMDEL